MPELTRKRLHIEAEGIVQGVGFRPFLHRVARENDLTGWCRNTVAGVEIEVEGTARGTEAFRLALEKEPPPLARITAIRCRECETLEGGCGFEIRQSLCAGTPDTLVSPDIATCPDCLREMRDPSDRRYRFPFINCTNCGPRFTIVRALPYDRVQTSMGAFPMCPDCDAEYHDIETRRYHAQPDCCPVCGPRLSFEPAAQSSGPATCGDALSDAKAWIAAGKIVALKGLGGFHLACRPDLPETVAELRRRKHRDERPFALMCRSADVVRQYCELSPDEERILSGPRAPIVLLQKKPSAPWGLSETNELGVMLPYTPLHHLLMEDFDILIMTSMNHSDVPVLCELGGASRWEDLADAKLTHDRVIVNRCDDSLLRVMEGKEYFFRRSRGYVPEPVSVTEDVTGILACGAEQKASFCLCRGKNAFLSQHIGDLKNSEVLEHYSTQIRRFEERFGVSVNRLVCDLHPDYLSTEYAQTRSRLEHLPLTQVQHHHAHMASCMADNGLTEDCIGVIWDGTGLGTDGTTWGGEVLAGGFHGFERLGSIDPIALPGGDACMKQIGRTAHSLLWSAGLAERSAAPQAELLSKMLEKNLNCPRSSGMGRLFDGVFCLLTRRMSVTYEGQGAVLLEAMASQDETAFYEPQVQHRQGILRLQTAEFVRCLLDDMDSGTPRAVLSARFHNSLVRLALEQCRFARERTGLNRVVLSGGVFQNGYLLLRLVRALEQDGFAAYHHCRAAANDEGIALGQTMIVAQGGGFPCV